MKYIVFTALLLMNFASINAQEKTNIVRTPPYLQKGDTIAILAPAGILKNREDTILKAKELMLFLI